MKVDTTRSIVNKAPVTHEETALPAKGRRGILEQALISEGALKTAARGAAQLLCAGVLALALGSSEARAQKAPEKPSIIYILADDAGYGDAGCYGQKDFQTPNIDAMAKEGMLFTDHYAGAPVCAPSRCSFLTGKTTGHGNIRGNNEILPEGQAPLDPKETTVAEVLKKAGYTTGIIGKWGLGAPGSVGVPSRHGFDYFYGYLCQRQAHNYYPDHLWRNATREALDGKTYTHDLLTADALQFIRRNSQRPFFLYLPYAIPHADLQVPDLGEYADKPWPLAKKKFAAMMTRMDRDIGRIITLLKKLKLSKKTLVIYTSDNGPHAEGGANPDFFNSSGSLRGKKRDLYEGGIRVPMVARWPGVIPAGVKSRHTSAFWDMLPTFAELAGSPVPGNTDGISMVPALKGNNKKQAKHTSLYWEFHEQGGKQALRMGKWKAVRLEVRLDPDAPLQLFDLDADPGERDNVASSYPEITAQMSRLMSSSRSVNKNFPLPGQMGYRPGLFHAWLFALPFFLTLLLTSFFGRGASRRENHRIFKQSAAPGKALLAAAFLAHSSLFAFTVWQPLWFGTWREDTGLVLCIIGLAGFLTARLHFLFRNPEKLPVRGLYRFSRNPSLIFTTLFWIGISISTASIHSLLILLLFILLNHWRILIQEKYYLDTFGDSFRSYRAATPRYLVFRG